MTGGRATGLDVDASIDFDIREGPYHKNAYSARIFLLRTVEYAHVSITIL